MLELKKTEHPIFKEYYKGSNGRKEVVCILDDRCVRYVVLEPGKWGMKQVLRREYSNSKKSLCFTNATKALNK